LGGGLIAIILVAVAAAVLAKPVDSLAALYGSAFHLQGLKFVAAAQVLGLAVALAWLGSWLAATRHIRGIAPT
jgi:cell division protein FtsX